MFVSADDEDNQSSNSTHTANVVSDSEKESDNEKEDTTLSNTYSIKRKLDEPLDPQEFGTLGTSEFNTKNINTR